MIPRRIVTLLALVFCFLAPLSAVTRVSFIHPGFMMKIPTTFIERSPYLFSSGFTTEIHNFSPYNQVTGVFFSMDVSDRFTLGFSSGTGANPEEIEKLQTSMETWVAPAEFGFHTQYKVFVRQDMSVSIGLHDIIFENDASEGLRLDPKQLSFFAAVGSEKEFGSYRRSTYMGFGTGGFSSASSAIGATADTEIDTTADEQGMGAGAFAGVLLNTPFMPKWGGIDFVGEFDGSGLNVGLRIPLTSDYRLGLGFTHIENLPDFSEKYSPKHPGIILNFTMNVPKGVSGLPGMPGGPSPVPDGIAGPGAGIIDSTLMAADGAVTVFRDSLKLSRHQVRNLATQVSLLQQKSVSLADSVKSLNLEKNVSQRNINRAMRHLSRSLRYFHSGDYREALQEVETALELNSNLALAYARRGSIYYQLGDPQRATINWNLALQMDPEYDDVRNILKALHENRLKTTSFSRNED